MISKKYNCIFVHIPKTAGQSVEHFFLNLHGLSWDDRAPLLLRYNPEREHGPERLAHLFAKEYLDLGYISKSEYSDFYSFSFVRNPWSRIVSEYQYRGYGKNMTFREFLLEGLPEKDSYTDAHRHIIPQYDYLYDDGHLLVDFVGKFESLQSDFDKVCEKLAIVNTTLPYANTSSSAGWGIKGFIKKITARVFGSKSKHYTTYYDEELVEVVRKMYVKDIEAFRYKYGE